MPIPEEEKRKLFAALIQRELVDYGIALEPAVRNSLLKVDRRNFIPHEYQEQIYENTVIPIRDNESSISQPSLVAHMLQLAEFSGAEKSLEVGTASGVNAAYMSHLAHEVHTIEQDGVLAKQARINLLREGRTNVAVHHGDGLTGVPQAAPFDRIIVTAGARDLPSVLFRQLAPGGRMVIPIGKYPYAQRLYTILNSPSGPRAEDHGQVSFVPLISDNQGGWPIELMNQLKSLQEEKMQNAYSEERV